MVTVLPALCQPLLGVTEPAVEELTFIVTQYWCWNANTRVVADAVPDNDEGDACHRSAEVDPVSGLGVTFQAEPVSTDTGVAVIVSVNDFDFPFRT